MCQPTSPRWRPKREIAWHLERYPWDPSRNSNSKRSPSSNAKIHSHLCLNIKKARVNHITYAELNLVSQATRQKRLHERQLNANLDGENSFSSLFCIRIATCEALSTRIRILLKLNFSKRKLYLSSTKPLNLLFQKCSPEWRRAACPHDRPM